MIHTTTQTKTIRCAVYTRKSTEEGLKQEFNSLDAQREAAESYIASQKSSNWICLPDRYDDGGYTGGNMDRPALKRLIADVEAGKIDCLVVYKVDRLSRSLFDFARIMDLLERHEIFFVSVTQPFNTSSSMGRLTLNTLLSFAQFEREIISERTRDKIAAARRKGKWSGGWPILGYDVSPGGGSLIVNEEEAARVLAIFALFLSWKTLQPVLEELDCRGWTNKRWTTREGHDHGGKPFDRSSLCALLGNVLYIGKIAYKSEVHHGKHPAIVEASVFEQAQTLFRSRERTRKERPRHTYNSMLGGILFCAFCGRAMGHTYTDRKNRRYRYYLCQSIQKGGRHRCHGRSVSATETERFVVSEIRRLGQDRRLLAEVLTRVQSPLSATEAADVTAAFERLNAAWDAFPPREQSRVMHLVVEKAICDSETGHLQITIHLDGIIAAVAETAGDAVAPQRPAGRLVIERDAPFGNTRNAQTQPQPTGWVPRVSKIMALAIKFDALVRNGSIADYADIARLGGVTRARVTQIMNLLHLAPDIQEDILFLPRVECGRDPITERNLRRIASMLEWETQRRTWEALQVGQSR